MIRSIGSSVPSRITNALVAATVIQGPYAPEMFTRTLARAGGGPVDVDAQVLAGVVRPVMRRIDPQWAKELRARVPENYQGSAVDRVHTHPILSS